MTATEGFSRVSHDVIFRNPAWCSLIDVEQTREQGLDLEKVKEHHIKAARNRMNDMGIPASRRLLCIRESTGYRGQPVIVVECADSNSASFR